MGGLQGRAPGAGLDHNSGGTGFCLQCLFVYSVFVSYVYSDVCWILDSFEEAGVFVL